MTYFPLFKGADPQRQSGAGGLSPRRRRSPSPRRTARCTSSRPRRPVIPTATRRRTLLTKAGSVVPVAAGGARRDGRDEDRQTSSSRAGTRTKYKAALAAPDAAIPRRSTRPQINWPMTILILFILVIYVTMVYGPIAAFLVELFPTRIRYTSMSLPYHIGNGWFGGMLPLLATAIVASRQHLRGALVPDHRAGSWGSSSGCAFLPGNQGRRHRQHLGSGSRRASWRDACRPSSRGVAPEFPPDLPSARASEFADSHLTLGLARAGRTIRRSGKRRDDGPMGTRSAYRWSHAAPEEFRGAAPPRRSRESRRSGQNALTVTTLTGTAALPVGSHRPGGALTLCVGNAARSPI